MSTRKPKPLIASQTPKRTSTHPVVLPSVTKKLHNKELKNTLVRRKRATAQTTYFDEAVPAHLHMKHLLKSASTELAVRHASHQHSPFVLNLKKPLPVPETLFEQEPLIQLNFLHPSVEALTHITAPTNSLILNLQDVQFQIHEDLSHIFSQSLEPVPSKTSASAKRFCQDFASVCLPNQSTLHLNSFVPQKTPEDIFAYFDLPEEEPDEVDESELVELDETVALKPLPTFNKDKPRFVLPSFLRPVGAFVIISFVFVLPLHATNIVSGLTQTKSQIESVSQEAFTYLKSGADAAVAQEQSAASAFSQAQLKFSQAQASIKEIGTGTSLLLSALPQTNSRLSMGKNLVSAGEHLTIAGSYMTNALDAIARETDPTPVSRIRLLQSYLQTTLPHMTQANQLMQEVDVKLIPEDQQTTFATIQTQLPIIVQTLTDFNELSDLAIHILGGTETKRYLLVFQNNTEIRPTGGFMGSFAELKVRDGVMERLNVPSGGTYDLQGLLQHSRIAPKPLQLINARWEFQDANWFPDFPTSARQMIEFYQDAGGPSIDGVITINATHVADLIGLLGPIDMPDYNRTIDQENFLFEAQKIVELEYDRMENTPKQFIGDLAPKLVERVLEGKPEQFLTLIDHLSIGLAQKDIQFYFTNEEIQRQILKHRWGGAIQEASQDYLMVIDSNLGGGKTDGVMEEHIQLNVEIDTNGSFVNTVTINRTHHGITGTTFTGVNNVDYVRMYVPKGSELINAHGFRIPDQSLFEQPEEDWIFDDDLQFTVATTLPNQPGATDVYEEQGKTVFGNWIQTAPGETSTVQFQYRLPFSLTKESDSFHDRLKTAVGIDAHFPYSLTIQKQAGTIDRTTEVSLSLPKERPMLWTSQDLSHLTFNNSVDAFFAILLK